MGGGGITWGIPKGAQSPEVNISGDVRGKAVFNPAKPRPRNNNNNMNNNANRNKWIKITIGSIAAQE